MVCNHDTVPLEEPHNYTEGCNHHKVTLEVPPHNTKVHTGSHQIMTTMEDPHNHNEGHIGKE